MHILRFNIYDYLCIFLKIYIYTYIKNDGKFSFSSTKEYFSEEKVKIRVSPDFSKRVVDIKSVFKFRATYMHNIVITFTSRIYVLE